MVRGGQRGHKGSGHNQVQIRVSVNLCEKYSGWINTKNEQLFDILTVSNFDELFIKRHCDNIQLSMVIT